MRIAIFGSGGVGGYFGARLAQAGEEVIFIARGEHLKAMQGHGLRVDSLAGNFSLDTVNATDKPDEVGEVDAILVGVKAWQVPEAAEAMRPLVGKNTFIVPLQNGIEAPSKLAAVVGEGHVLGGLCGLISFLVEPGHIRHAGAEPFIAFGELDNRVSDRVKKLQGAIDKAEGAKANVPSDINVAMWDKFMFVAAWSGVGAITRSPLGTFRSQPESREMLGQALTETYEVAQARGVRLALDSVNAMIARYDKLPEAGTASMQRDIMAGRPSELEQQNGAVVRLGKEAGVETPINSFIYHSLLPMERRARGEIQFQV
ncbi:MAG: 2-dehydropantoate 2-reductase [Burkholderiales bacterium]|nr:2-dehydropantoate 2-reductase [Burkholderiales bacterium]